MNHFIKEFISIDSDAQKDLELLKVSKSLQLSRAVADRLKRSIIKAYNAEQQARIDANKEQAVRAARYLGRSY